MSDCLFCNIIAGKMETEFIYEDDKVVVFADINSQAPVHYLIVPRKHVPTIMDLKKSDNELVGHIYQVATHLAEETGIAEDGFRVVSNCGKAGGQSVFHIHFHLLGGRSMQWPPG